MIAVLATAEDGDRGSMDEVERAYDGGKPVIAVWARSNDVSDESSYLEGLFLARSVPFARSSCELLSLLAVPRIVFALEQQRRAGMWKAA